jgi:hypothetical protein
MNQPEPTSQPEPEQTQEFVSARARRRRALRRAYFPTDEEGRAELFAHLSRRAFPSYELFVFSLVAGVILGLGYFLDSQGLLVFGVLVAPLLTPWIGTMLAIVAGSGRLFMQTLAAIFVSSLLIFGSGVLAGFALRIYEPRTFNEAFLHSRLWWPDLIVLTIAAILLTISFVRSEERPYLPSALLAYELLLPLCAAGFGLGSGVTEIWPLGLYVFFVHLAWATFFGILTLFFLRFYPTSFGGLAFTGIAFIALITIVIFLTGFDQWIKIQAGLASPRPDPTPQATSTLALIPTIITPSLNPEPTTAFIGVPTGTPSRTPRPTSISPTSTPTLTITAEPTPIIALVRAPEGGGAFIRERPGGQGVTILPNGWAVTIVPNDIQELNGVTWVHVIAIINDTRVEGWMIQSLLVTATPAPNWQPSPTP